MEVSLKQLTLTKSISFASLFPKNRSLNSPLTIVDPLPLISLLSALELIVLLKMPTESFTEEPSSTTPVNRRTPIPESSIVLLPPAERETC